jgi:hypothetical protein
MVAVGEHVWVAAGHVVHMLDARNQAPPCPIYGIGIGRSHGLDNGRIDRLGSGPVHSLAITGSLLTAPYAATACPSLQARVLVSTPWGEGPCALEVLVSTPEYSRVLASTPWWRGRAVQAAGVRRLESHTGFVSWLLPARQVGAVPCGVPREYPVSTREHPASAP